MATPEEKLVQGNWYVIKLFLSIYLAITLVGMVFAFLVSGWPAVGFIGGIAFFGYLVIMAIYYEHGGTS